MINRLSANEQMKLIRKRDVSAREVLEAHLDEISSRNAKVNAFITIDEDGARQTADHLDAKAKWGEWTGPLHGLPVGIKDTAPVRGMRYTSGSLLYKDRVSDQDAHHVANLRSAGAVILGKTNAPAFGHGRHGGQTDNAIVGLTRNPLDLRKTTSSSSGGSAAALAAHFVALADGSDIAGSIRGPAAWCGLYGLRPTSGVVPFWPKIDPFVGTDVIGPMARTIDDLALFFDALRRPNIAPLHEVPDAISSTSSPFTGLRVAWCMNPDGAKTTNAVLRAINPLKKILTDAGAIVEDVQPVLSGLHAAQSTLRCFGFRVNRGAELEANRHLCSDEILVTLDRANALTADEVVEAQRTRNRVIVRITQFFEAYDIMVWPTSTHPPYDAEAMAADIKEDWKPLELTPVLEIPALTIPVGTTLDGMPCGAQLIGPTLTSCFEP